MIKLSIITINLNDASGLEKTLSSVWERQSFKGFEHIVIDGGSTDGSVDVIKRYADKLTYWVSEPDKGIYNAMNKGIVKAKGEYLLFLNGGDWLEDDVLAEVFAKDLNSDIVYGNRTLQKTNGKIERDNYTEKNIISTLFCSSLPHQSSFIKRTLFENSLYREDFKIVSDWAFFIQKIIVENCSVKHVDINISYFNMYGISASEEAAKKIQKEKEQFLAEIVGNSFASAIITLGEDKKELYYITDFQTKEFTSSPWLLHHTRKCVRVLFKLKKFLGVRH